MTRNPKSNTGTKPSPFRPARGERALSFPTGMPPFWRLCLVLALILTVLPATIVHAADTVPMSRVTQSSGTRAAIAHLLRVVNHERVIRGLRPLRLSRPQSRCSLKHSRHMFAERVASHDQFPADICVHYQLSAENVGVITAPPQPALLHLNWMMMREGPCPHVGCPGGEYAEHNHYVNLMNPVFGRIGIGVLFRDGTTWLTEDMTG